jgi:hypothetical protein
VDAVRLEGVTLRYRMPRERIGSFKEYAIRRLQRGLLFEGSTSRCSRGRRWA